MSDDEIKRNEEVIVDDAQKVIPDRVETNNVIKNYHNAVRKGIIYIPKDDDSDDGEIFNL